MALPASHSHASAAYFDISDSTTFSDRSCVLDTHAVYKSRFQKKKKTAVNTDVVLLIASMSKVLKEVFKESSIIVEGKISVNKLWKAKQGSWLFKHFFPKFTFNIFQNKSSSYY